MGIDVNFIVVRLFHSSKQLRSWGQSNWLRSKLLFFDVEVIRRFEIFVYRFKGSSDEHPTLISYRLTTHKLDYKLRSNLTYCTSIHALVAIDVAMPMDGCAIYKALNWTYHFIWWQSLGEDCKLSASWNATQVFHIFFSLFSLFSFCSLYFYFKVILYYMTKQRQDRC